MMLLTTGVSALLKCSKVIDSVIIGNAEVMAGRGNLGEYDNWEEKTPVDIQCLKFSGRGVCKAFTGTVREDGISGTLYCQGAERTAMSAAAGTWSKAALESGTQ